MQILGVDDDAVGLRYTADVTAGEVFLDCDFDAASHIPRKIGYAETALAEGFANQIFAVENVPLRQVVQRRGRIVGAFFTSYAHPRRIEVAETVKAYVFVGSHFYHIEK